LQLRDASPAAGAEDWRWSAFTLHRWDIEKRSSRAMWPCIESTVTVSSSRVSSTKARTTRGSY